MEEKIFTLGPWGGNNGGKWDDGYFSGVRKIEVEYNGFHRVIDSITVVYADSNGRSVRRERHGGNYPRRGSTKKEIVLKYPEEYLIGLSGHITYRRIDGGQFIQSLSFTTNLKTHGPIGYQEYGNTPFAFKLGILEIVGFYGRSGWFLDSIGIHLRHRKTTKNAITETTVQHQADHDESTDEPGGGGNGHGIHFPDLGINWRIGRRGKHRKVKESRVEQAFPGVAKSVKSAPDEVSSISEGSESGGDDLALRTYGKDITELAKAGKLDPVIGRDEEIRRCIQILIRRTIRISNNSSYY